MRLDLLLPNSWENANQQARSALLKTNLEIDFQARCYKGLVAALFEVFAGTASFLSHKRTLGAVVGQSWAQLGVLPFLLRENFQLKNFTVADMQDPAKFITELGDEVSAVLWPEDHPITAEAFDGEALDAELNKKRIFSIRLSHHAFWTRAFTLRPYSVRLCSVQNDLAVAMLGTRFKTPSIFASYQYWDLKQMPAALSFLNRAEDKQLVQNFESQVNNSWSPMLQTTSRIWDRAALYHPQLSGDQVMHELAKILKTEIKPVGLDQSFESIHLCRWESSLQDIQWWKTQPHADVLRGSVFLHLSLLKQPSVREYFGCSS